MKEKILSRLNELLTEAQTIENNKYTGSNIYGKPTLYVNKQLYISWVVKSRSLVSNICGRDSEYFKDFIKFEKSSNNTNYDSIRNLQAIMKSFKEDYETGFISTVKELVEADIFDTQLEQATELLEKKYFVASAVVCGVVLETYLRNICIDNNLQAGSLNKMNQDLTKAGKITKLRQKQITALADLRNSAAHGNTVGIKSDDIKNMIHEVRGIITIN